MQSHKVKIISCEYECGDECCYDHWYEVKLDGEYLSIPNEYDPRYPSILRFHNEEDIFVAVAKELGIDLVVTYTEEDNE